jgi:hypothetical protein
MSKIKLEKPEMWEAFGKQKTDPPKWLVYLVAFLIWIFAPFIVIAAIVKLIFF